MDGGDGLTGQSPWAAWMSLWQRPEVWIPDDDLALTGDWLGNLLDDEQPREVLDDRGPALSWPQPFEPAACAQ